MTSGAGITSAAMDAEDGTWDIAHAGHTLTPFELPLTSLHTY